MNFDRHVVRMRRSAAAIESLSREVTDDQARWKPAPNSWSILEVVNHLCDEEREDFRLRLDIMLHRPEASMPRIDPVGWVTERRYNERDLDASVDAFLTERKNSLRWLTTLASPNWAVVYHMPWGPMTAGDMLASWVFHDLLHVRQLVRLHLGYTKIDLNPFDVTYAGAL